MNILSAKVHKSGGFVPFGSGAIEGTVMAQRTAPDGDLAGQILGWLLGATCCASRSSAPPPRGAGAGPRTPPERRGFAASQGGGGGTFEGVVGPAGVGGSGTPPHISPESFENDQVLTVEQCRADARSVDSLIAMLADLRADWKARVSAMQIVVQLFESMGPRTPCYMIELIPVFCKHLALQVLISINSWHLKFAPAHKICLDAEPSPRNRSKT